MEKPKTKLDEAAVPFATITELATALRAREISSVELTKIFGKRLETLGPQYNALACSLVKEGHKAAKDADDELKRERFRSPLQGIPYAVKDLIAVAKYPTTWGAKPFADQVFDYNATVVNRLDSEQGHSHRQTCRWSSSPVAADTVPPPHLCKVPGSIPGTNRTGLAALRAAPARRWLPAWFPTRSAPKLPAPS